MRSNNNTILIVLVAGIGDCILASKAFRALRNGYPDAELHLLTSTDAVPLASRYPCIDKVFGFPIREFRFRKTVFFSMLRTVMQVRKNKYRMIINLHPVASPAGAIRMGILFLLLRASLKIGHEYPLYSFFVNKKYTTDMFLGNHYADGMVSVAVLAGGQDDHGGIDVFYKPDTAEKWHDLFAPDPLKPKQPMVAVNPGSDQPRKRIRVDVLAAAAGIITERYQARIVLLGGPGETLLCRSLSEAIHAPVIDLAGKMTLDDLVYIVSRLDLLITSDSAPMHIAAALNVKQVAIFGPGFPEHFHPYTSQRHYRMVFKELDCRPCTEPQCRHLSCLEKIRIEDILSAVDSLMSDPGTRTI